MRPRRIHHLKRRAIAAVEFALVLPIVVLLLVGAIEAARAVMVTHSLQEAAQAGCRVYSVEDGSYAAAKKIVTTALKEAGIDNPAIAFDPPSKSQVDVAMEPVTVTVTMPFAQVAWLPPSFLSGATLQGRCVMPADLDNSDGGDTNGYTSVDDDNNFDGFERDNESTGGGDDDDD